ncbi:hypothetical protein AVEN_206153-1 [Araneus ventricosus]|uniref:Uncharacterized protein n=1 Tax=Araneus ventricosus TaxID=182803 RepID=A0A4Y2N434_ARAVE|nr:hypothetical protein AVEN_206153-1 [Araneus ventricosus]
MRKKQKTMQKTMVELYCRLPMLSLQKMSITRITTTLCNNRQLLGLIMKCKHQEHFDHILYTRRGPEWAAVKAMANEMVSQICNCVKLNERIMEFLWPVCYSRIRNPPEIPEKLLNFASKGPENS